MSFQILQLLIFNYNPFFLYLYWFFGLTILPGGNVDGCSTSFEILDSSLRIGVVLLL